jgi:hypothetical protein
VVRSQGAWKTGANLAKCVLYLDQSRPICTRCSKGNFTCLGYRDALFIDEGWQVQQQRHRGPALQPQTSHPSYKTEDEPPPLDLTKIITKPQQSPYFYQESQVLPPLSLSAWKDDIFVSYLIADIGPMGAIYRNLVAPNYYPDSPQRSAGKQSFLALATTFYGVGHAQESLVDDGRRRYSRALEMVNEAIGNTSPLVIKEALSSVAALCLHEVRSCSPPVSGFLR